MLYIVSTTGGCNLSCSYCGGSMPASMMPLEIQYDVEALASLVRKDGDSTVAFYGGEPLLRIPRIVEIMRRVPAKRFVLQTNGLFLRALPDACLERMDAVLVSLDGRPSTTDANRGHGTHRRVMENVAEVRSRYRGDLTARMTATEATDIEEDVLFLLREGFDHVHWQLNAIWSPDGSWRDFSGWVESSYNPGITRLRKRWVAAMEQGTILGIAPFQGVLTRLRSGATGLPCGAGHDAFAVTTDGAVLGCPIGPEYEWNRLARLPDATPQGLRGRLAPEGPCRTCDVADVCGGRCLFANREAGAKRREFDLVCTTVKHLVAEMRQAHAAIEPLLHAGTITPAQIAYPSFNNTIEVIP